MKKILLGAATAVAVVIAGSAPAMAAPTVGGTPPAPPAAAKPAGTKTTASAENPKKTLEGVLRTLAADTVEGDYTGTKFKGKSHDNYAKVLVVGDKTYFLKGKKAAAAKPNRRVRVSGPVSGLNVTAETILDMGAAAGGVPSSGTTRVLVMLAHWNTPDTVTQASAQAQMFTDSSAWYRDASYGALGLTGAVTPWMRIAGPTGGACYADHMNTMTQAKNAAVAQGYNLANYDNFVLYSPNNSWQAGSDCSGYAGWAYVGAQNTWLNGYMDRRASVHELGHNYGLHHAHSYLCSSGVTGTCSYSDYGDEYDAMGSSDTVGHFSASQKELLGWMAGRKTDLTAGGTATLAPLAADAVSVSSAQVRVSPSRSYWVEYRRPVDYDAGLPTYGTDGIQVRVMDTSISAGDTGASLLDARTGDALGTNTATLRAGEAWTSPEGYRFTASSVTGTSAAINVVPGTPVVCPDSALEPDNTAGSARTMTPGTQKRAFCSDYDEDWIKFSATAGATYVVDTLNLSAGTDTILELIGTDGTTVLTSNDDALSNSLASRVQLKPTVSGTYYAKARAYDGSSGVDRTYDLRLTQQGDAIAPTVTGRTPAVNATGVSTTADLNATFSEGVNGVSATTFTLKNTATNAAIAATVTRNGTTNQWILNPSANLANDTRYTATLTGSTTAIRDAAGNPLATTSWTFTTGPVPTVTARAPGVNATGASTTANLTATFSEGVNGVSASTFTLKNTATNAAIAATVTRNGTTNQWILNPSANLANDTRYTATLTGSTTAIRDAAGNPLATTSWTFTTGPVPTVTARTPGVNATAVSRTANIAATFSEGVASVSTSTFKLKNTATGAAVAGVVSRNGTTNQWILNPGVTLSARTQYTATLTGSTTAIRDAAGNPLASISWNFTTGA